VSYQLTTSYDLSGTLRKKKKTLEMDKEIAWTRNPIVQPLLKSVEPGDWKMAKETFLIIMKYMVRRRRRSMLPRTPSRPLDR
jgi:hypothetical protein